jgi:hypothetical protein
VGNGIETWPVIYDLNPGSADQPDHQEEAELSAAKYNRKRKHLLMETSQHAELSSLSMRPTVITLL